MQANLVQAQAEKSRFVRQVLKANAIFTTISGVAITLFAGGLAELMGVPASWPLIVIGLGLLPFAAFVIYVARTEPLHRSLVMVVVVMDALWVLGSALLLGSGLLEMSTAGKWLVGLLAEVVFIFAVLEIIGLRRS